MAEVAIKVRGTRKVSSLEAAARLDAEGGGTGRYGGLPIEVEGLGLYKEWKEHHPTAKPPPKPTPVGPLRRASVSPLSHLPSALPALPTPLSTPRSESSLTPSSSVRSISSLRSPSSSLGPSGSPLNWPLGENVSVNHRRPPEAAPHAVKTTTTSVKLSYPNAGLAESLAAIASFPRSGSLSLPTAATVPNTPPRANSCPPSTPPTPSTPSTPGTAGLKAGKASSPSVRVTVSEPKVVAARTQVQQTFSVASLADAEALSPDGYFHGMPIEVRGLGLYAELKGHLAPHPGTSSVQAKPKSPTNGLLSAVPNGLASAQPSHTVANRTPEAPGGRKASCDLRDAPVVAPRTTPRSPLSDGTAATPSKSPGQRPLFHESAFKAHYNATPAPEYPHQLLEAVHALVVGYAARKGLERPKAEAFFRELQDTAFRNVEELLSDIQAVAGRIWTSPRRLEEMEFCFILNDVLRCDMAELMQPAATITRAINLLLVNARLCGGVAGTVYRGGGLPDEHRGFFTPRKTYRIPMFLATTIDQQTSKDKFCRRADLKFRLPPVLWIIELGREIGCMHVNYLHMSECHGEQEYLFAPYSAFTVDEVAWKAKPTWQDPHVVRLTAVSDNRLAPETLPLAPWA